MFNQVGRCSVKNKLVGFQFSEDDGRYVAVGSYNYMGGGTDGSDKQVEGAFFVSPTFKCRGCGNTHLYQCCHCMTFICYDGKAKSNVVCPNPDCGKTSKVPEANAQGAIMRSGCKVSVKPDIVLAIDTSYSMVGSRLREVKAAAKGFVAQYSGKCRMALVEFGHYHKVLVGLTDVLGRISSAIRALHADNGTPSPFPIILRDAMLEEFRTSPNPRYVVVFTDGMWNDGVGPNVQLANELKAMGITIIAIGCAGANQSFLTAISSPDAAIGVRDGDIAGGFAGAAKIIGGQG